MDDLDRPVLSLHKNRAQGFVTRGEPSKTLFERRNVEFSVETRCRGDVETGVTRRQLIVKPETLLGIRQLQAVRARQGLRPLDLVQLQILEGQPGEQFLLVPGDRRLQLIGQSTGWRTDTQAVSHGPDLDAPLAKTQ